MWKYLVGLYDLIVIWFTLKTSFRVLFWGNSCGCGAASNRNPPPPPRFLQTFLSSPPGLSCLDLSESSPHLQPALVALLSSGEDRSEAVVGHLAGGGRLGGAPCRGSPWCSLCIFFSLPLLSPWRESLSFLRSRSLSLSLSLSVSLLLRLLFSADRDRFPRESN